MVDNFIFKIKSNSINEMLLKQTEKQFNDLRNTKKRNTDENGNNDDGFVNLNDTNNDDGFVNLNDTNNDDSEIIDENEILKEIIKECQRNNLSFNETTYITSNIQMRLEHKFVCNNDKTDNEDILTKSLIRSLVKNLIGSNENQEEEEEEEPIPDLKGKTIHELKVNSYKSYEFFPFYYYIYISHLTIPETIRNEIDRELRTIKYFSRSHIVGFENKEKLELALKKLTKNPNRSKVEIGNYKEGKKLINVSYETRELYLFYESL